MLKKIALLLPIIAGTCWGCSGVFVRILDETGFNIITITFSRVSIVVVLLGLVILVHDRSLFRVPIRQLPLLALVGMAGYFFFSLCYNAAVLKLSLSLATVLLCTAPVFVILFSSVLFKEKITPIRVTCMLAALIGCVLMSGIVESCGLKWSIIGILLGIGSAICNATSIMSTNEATDIRKIHPLTVQFYSALFALVPMFFLTDYSAIGGFVVERPLTRILFLIVYALVAALLPNLLFNISFKYVDAGVVSILAAGAEPTSALLFGLFIYHEIPTVFGLAGIIIVITAIIILSRSDMAGTGASEKDSSECGDDPNLYSCSSLT